MRDLVTGEIFFARGDAVVLATGGYGNVFFLSTNAKGCNVTAIWRAYKQGALFANPCYTQIHPTCIPVSGDHQSKLTLDVRIAAQRRPRVGAEAQGRQPAARRDSRRRPRLFSRTQVSELRQSCAARHRFARRERSLRRRPRRRSRAGGAFIWISRTRSSGSAKRRFASATAICSTCTSGSPARTLTNSRCAFIRQCITRWAGCGWTTT